MYVPPVAVSVQLPLPVSISQPLDEVARRVASGAERAMNEFIADFEETFNV